MGNSCGCDAGPPMNSAFVFIKPHAVTGAVKKLIEQKLALNNISVLRSGEIKAEQIDKESLIDNHYGAIAARAMKQTPPELTVQESAQEEFRKLFGLSWTDALKQGKVYNSVDGAKKLGVDLEELGMRFDKLKRGVDQLKFGGGFYVGKLGDMFVVNGFYAKMRGKFTKPGTSIWFYEVRWNPELLSWQDFRANVIGATDPKTANAGSCRAEILGGWKGLGLEFEPSTGDNGVHASASPFEGLVEKANWLKASVGSDAFGKKMIDAGVSEAKILEWGQDPPVMFEGKKQSLFDLLEDLDASECINKAVNISKGG